MSVSMDCIFPIISEAIIMHSHPIIQGYTTYAIEESQSTNQESINQST
jgi:hypothetical protein